MTLKRLYKPLVGLVVVLGLLLLTQLWFQPFDEILFMKILVTVIVLFVIVGAIIAIRSDVESEEQMRKDKYLN